MSSDSFEGRILPWGLGPRNTNVFKAYVNAKAMITNGDLDKNSYKIVEGIKVMS